MAEDKYTYKQLVSSSDPSFDELYNIYVESIPLRERKPKARLSSIIPRTDYKILLLNRNGVVIGFSILFRPNESFCLLEYMAVHSGHRNKGLGTKLFIHTFQGVIAHCGTVYGLLEIDSDREQSVDHDIRRRRQFFYRGLGCLRVEGLSYLLPLPGEDPPPQMDLMVYIPDGPSVIRRCQLKNSLKVIYDRVYDCPPDDPRIVFMMEAVDDPVKLV